MISSSKIQVSYNHLYDQLRNYIWSPEVVKDIADLEISAYKAFPDLEDMRKCYDRLKRDVKYEVKDDEELDEAFDDLNESLNAANDLYLILDARQEVM